MGVKPAYVLLRFVSFYYFLFSVTSSRIMYRFFRDRIGFGRFKTIGKIYTNYYLFGQSLIDKVVLMAGIPHPFTFDFDGEEHLREMVARGQGGLLLSSHIGNWEIAGHLLQRLGTRIHIVMFDGEHERIKQYLTGVTGERRAHIIVIKDDLSHIYAISEALRQQELVCMHADRFVEGSRTLTTTFLGLDARFPAGPFILASTFKVPVSFVFALKEGSTHYHFYASPPVALEASAIGSAAGGSRTEPGAGAGGRLGLGSMVAAFSEAMEEKVKKYPEQWYNYYNFWQS
jgi:predicted LPLAT superfamily acyltransferase